MTYPIEVVCRSGHGCGAPNGNRNDELRVTLAYPDPPGTTSATLHRINDLSLRVVSPSGAVYHGNNGLLAGNYSTPGGSPNTVDTVESVLVPNAEVGTWTVEVRAAEVNVDAYPATPAADAAFALVVTGGVLASKGSRRTSASCGYALGLTHLSDWASWSQTQDALTGGGGGGMSRGLFFSPPPYSFPPAPGRRGSHSAPSSGSTRTRRTYKLRPRWPRTVRAISSSSGRAETHSRVTRRLSASDTPVTAVLWARSSKSTRTRRMDSSGPRWPWTVRAILSSFGRVTSRTVRPHHPLRQSGTGRLRPEVRKLRRSPRSRISCQLLYDWSRALRW